MKHNLKITAILLLMFLLTQFIGLYVINHYSNNDLPLGLETPEVEEPREYNQLFVSIIFAFVIAISLLFLLTHFKSEFLLRIWFLVVIIIGLVIALTSMIPFFKYSLLITLILVVPLALVKVYKQDFIVHNITELFIYPGISAVFVPIFNVWTIIALLILISIYDAWAVWHSGIMQKMAKYQINKLKVFSGFFIPYVSNRMRMKLKKLKKSELKKKKIKVNVAILGGGDVIFPIITAGVFLRTNPFGLSGVQVLIPSLLIILGAALGLTYLFFFAEKKKFYPAMPFISAGIFLMMGLSWLIF